MRCGIVPTPLTLGISTGLEGGPVAGATLLGDHLRWPVPVLSLSRRPVFTTRVASKVTSQLLTGRLLRQFFSPAPLITYCSDPSWSN